MSSKKTRDQELSARIRSLPTASAAGRYVGRENPKIDVIMANAAFRKRKAAKAKPVPRSTAGLSVPAQRYLRALADPKGAQPCGVPTAWPLAPSFKAKCWSIGTLSIGTQGVGFLQLSPNRTIANDSTSIYYSGATYALSTLPATFVEVGVANTNTNALYTAADYTANVSGTQGRLVACCATVRYTGTELDLAGEVTALRHPDNRALTGAQSQSDLLKFPNARVVVATSKREEVRLMWMPIDANDVEYDDVNTSAPLSMAFLIRGTAASTYHFEVFTIYEVIGPTVPSRSLSVGDPEGLAAVITAGECEDATWSSSLSSFMRSLSSAANAALQQMSTPLAKGVVDFAARNAGKFLAHSVSAAASGPIPTLTIEEVYDDLARPCTVNDVPIAPCSYSEFWSRVQSGEYKLLAREPHILISSGDCDYKCKYKHEKYHFKQLNTMVPTKVPPQTLRRV